MSRFRALVLAPFVSVLVIGCGATGGTIGGVPAPKLTKGTLLEGRYAPKDKSFSVAVPFPPGSAGYTTMEIAEKSEGEGNLVAFSSKAHPGEVYRVTTYPNVKPANRLAETTVAAYRKQMETTGGAPLRAEKVNQELIDGILAISHRYSQAIPARTSDGARSKVLVSMHSTHFLQRSTRAAFIVVNRAADGSGAGAEGGEARGVAFLKSFRLR